MMLAVHEAAQRPADSFGSEVELGCNLLKQQGCFRCQVATAGLRAASRG